MKEQKHCDLCWRTATTSTSEPRCVDKYCLCHKESPSTSGGGSPGGNPSPSPTYEYKTACGCPSDYTNPTGSCGAKSCRNNKTSKGICGFPMKDGACGSTNCKEHYQEPTSVEEWEVSLRDKWNDWDINDKIIFIKSLLENQKKEIRKTIEQKKVEYQRDPHGLHDTEYAVTNAYLKMMDLLN